MEFIDTHCHLYWPDFAGDLAEVLYRARLAGVHRCIIPSTDLPTFEQAAAIANVEKGVYLAAGVHPHDAAAADGDVMEELRKAAAHPRVVAIGEIGLDYHYDFSPRDVQQKLLHQQLELALSLGLPVILHNRESDDDLLAVVKEHQDGSLEGQFHCFSSDAVYAMRVLDAGFHISFTGNVTYKKSTLDPLISLVPDDRLLIETDAPFMTPHPFRGKRNEPSHIPLIAARFAQARHQSAEYVAAITTRNAERLFLLNDTGANT